MAFLAPIMAALPAITAVATLAGGAVAAAGALQQGAAAKQAANFRAQQEQIAAGEARAAAQRQAQERRREGNLLQSTLTARAAASGASASDPTVTDLGGDIAARSELAALTEMYRGENRARGLQDAATADILSGQAAQTGSYYQAGGTLLSSIGTAGMAGRFSSPTSFAGNNPLDEYLYGRPRFG